MKKSLWLLLFIIPYALRAQVKLKPISLHAAETLSKIGHQNIKTAWIVSGADTMYTFHFAADALVAQKSLFEADSIWLANDSVYYQNQLFHGGFFRLAVYYQNKLKRQSFSTNGKLNSANLWEHDSLGRVVYHRQWHPSQVQTTIKHPNGMQEWWFEDVYTDSKTVRKQHADTNRVWSLLGKDTSSHRFTWTNYSEEMRSKPYYVSKEWWDGERRTHLVLADGFADSTIVYEHDNERETWQYQPVDNDSAYALVAYNRVYGLKQPMATYRFLPANDTARYTFITFAVVTGGHYKKTQELRLKKDSARYRQIDYFWKPNGEIDHLEITNRWGWKRKVKPNWEDYKSLDSYGTHTMHPHLNEPEPIRYRIEIINPDIHTITVGNAHLDQLFYQKITVQVLDPEQLAEKHWIEKVLFELDENGVLVNIQTTRNTVLGVAELKRAISNSPWKLPGNTNTNLIYLDNQGKKHVIPKKITLLPVTVLVQER
jgi:hypothetical protein